MHSFFTHPRLLPTSEIWVGSSSNMCLEGLVASAKFCESGMSFSILRMSHICQLWRLHICSDDPPLEGGLTHFENPLFKSGSTHHLWGDFSLWFCSGFSSCLSFSDMVGRPTVKMDGKPIPKPTFWQWVDPPRQEGPKEQSKILCDVGSSSYWPTFYGWVDSFNFALARDAFKHIREEGPTHFPRVGRISGCVKKLCINQSYKRLNILTKNNAISTT